MKRALVALLMVLALVSLRAQAGAVGPSSVVAIARTPSGHGYWLMNASGKVFSFGDALALGDFPTEEGAYASLVATQNGKGLWAITVGPAGVAGHLHALGMARDFGDFGLTDCCCGCPCCRGLVAPTSDRGLLGLTSDGQLVSVGRVSDLGDFPPPLPEDEYVSLVATRSGRGLWAVTAGGAVKTLGSARTFGNFASTGGGTCCRGLVAPTSGKGLWGFSADGHIQRLGRVPDLGDLPAPLSGDGYTSMVATPSGHGLWAVTEGGHVGTVGDAVFLGDLSDSGACLSCVP